VKGIGPKTACALVTHYGSVSGLYAKINAPPPLSSSSSSSLSDSSLLPSSDSTQQVKIPKPRRKSKKVVESVSETEVLIVTDSDLDTKIIVKTETEIETEVVLESNDNDNDKVVLSELTLSLSNVKASAVTTLKRLKTSVYKDVALFKELVTLRDDVYMPELHGYLDNGNSNNDGNNNNRDSSNNDNNDNIGVNNETNRIPLLFPEILNKNMNNEIFISSKNSKIDTSHFRYFGESDNAENLLLDMSVSFSTPLNLLRQQYSKLERTLGKNKF
jgi:hypothetical protein